MRPANLIALTSARGADASRAFEVPGTGPIRWTLAEAGMACAGMARHIYFAMRYSYAGDDSCFRSLYRALGEDTSSLARDERWPAEIEPMRFAGVALIEELAPWRFKGDPKDPGSDIRPLVLRVSPHIWRRTGSRAYEAVRATYASWTDSGTRQMRAWLRREEIA